MKTIKIKPRDILGIRFQEKFGLTYYEKYFDDFMCFMEQYAGRVVTIGDINDYIPLNFVIEDWMYEEI